MRRRKLLLTCAVLAMVILLLPVAGADAVGELESGFVLFSGYNLLEVTPLGWLPLLCPAMIVTAFNFKILEKVLAAIVILCPVLSCLGWLAGTVCAREFLLNMESIAPIVIEYGAGLPLSMIINIAMLLIAVSPTSKKSTEEEFDHA